MGKNQQHIDDFLLGRLTKKKAADFQKEMQTDPELEKEVHFHENMMKGLQTFGNKELKGRLQEMHLQMEKERKSPPFFKLRSLTGVLAVAASFLIIAFCLYWLFFTTSPPTEDLYAGYFEPYRVSFAARSNVNAEELTLAGTYYFNKQYQAGLPLLESLSQQIPNDLDVQLALATTYLELSQIPKAQRLFERIIQDANPLYHEQARWFLALSYIQLEEFAKAKTALQALIDNPTAFKHAEARELAGKL